MGTSNIFKIFFLVLLLSCLSYSQDSLYLVDTIKGTSTTNPLMDARGIGDMNGDGYADFILCYDNNIDLYYGNPDFKLKLAHSFPLSHFYLPHYDNGLRGSAYPIGDVNGDGYTDLMILDYDTTYFPAYPYWEIIFGGKLLDTIPKFTYYAPYTWNMLPSDEIHPLGDLDGDGYNEFAISTTYNWDDYLGRVYIFKGGKNVSEIPWKIFTDTSGIATQFGKIVSGIGDYNNDGYDDILIQAISNSTKDSDRVYLYLGNKDSLNNVPNKNLNTSLFKLVYNIKPAGDLNRDGKKDFIITADFKAFIFKDTLAPIIIDTNKFKYQGFYSIGAGGDINGDGYDDFLLGYPDYINAHDSMVGATFGFLGNSSLDFTNSKIILTEGNHKWFSFGVDSDIAGDINGDGYDDVFIMELGYKAPDEYATCGKLYIYSYKKIDAVNEYKNTVPNDFILNQNYPNPFNPSTVISYNLSKGSKVTLKVYDILGKEIKTLADEVQNAGSHTITFNVSNLSLSSGVYFVKMNAESQNSSKSFNKVIKIMYLK